MSGTITAIRLQKKDPRRANLHIDGEFALGLSLEVVQDFGLRRGMVLSEADIEALRQAEKKRRAYQDALRLISYRQRSVDELSRRLLQKGYDEPQVEATVSRLQDLGLLDDLGFARSWVENRLVFHPRGRRALEDELRRKGISAQIIKQVLDEAMAEDDERRMALELARDRASSLVGLERQVFWRRLQGFLARRGFPPGVVYEVVGRVWEELEGSE